MPRCRSRSFTSNYDPYAEKASVRDLNLTCPNPLEYDTIRLISSTPKKGRKPNTLDSPLDSNTTIHHPYDVRSFEKNFVGLKDIWMDNKSRPTSRDRIHSSSRSSMKKLDLSGSKCNTSSKKWGREFHRPYNFPRPCCPDSSELKCNQTQFPQVIPKKFQSSCPLVKLEKNCSRTIKEEPKSSSCAMQSCCKSKKSKEICPETEKKAAPIEVWWFFFFLFNFKN